MRRALILRCSIVRTDAEERTIDSGGRSFARRVILFFGDEFMNKLPRQRIVPTMSAKLF